MFSYFLWTPRKRASLSALFVSTMLGLSLFLTACGNTSTTTTTNSSIAAPTDLIASGTLTVGSDTTYPPQEFIDTTSGKATGFDIDLITAMAQRMGLQANIKAANFNTIIDDLSAKRYDVVISAITINDDRKKKVDFV